METGLVAHGLSSDGDHMMYESMGSIDRSMSGNWEEINNQARRKESLGLAREDIGHPTNHRNFKMVPGSSLDVLFSSKGQKEDRYLRGSYLPIRG